MAHVLLAVKDLETDQQCTLSFLYIFCVLQLTLYDIEGRKKKRSPRFCFRSCFVILETHIDSWFQKSCLITCVFFFFPARSKIKITSIEAECPQLLLTSAMTACTVLFNGLILLGWSWCPRSLSFKPHWLKLAGTKILVPDLHISQVTMGWLSQGKCLPHYVLSYSSLFELSERNFLALAL